MYAIRMPFLLPLFGVFVAILFGPSLCHLPDNGHDDDELRLSLPLLLAAIPASFCLKVPKEEGGSAVSVGELVTVSRWLCDVFETFWYHNLTEMLQEALLNEIAVEDKAGMLRLKAIIDACKDDDHYHKLSMSLIKFLKGNTSVTGFESKIRSISNKMITLLIYDRLYRIFERQLEAIIDQNNYASEDEKNAEFALKWLKQMRKAISTRYEEDEAELKYLLDKGGKALGGTLIDREESDRKERREQMAVKCSLRLDRLRNKSAARVDAGALHLGDEDKERMEAALFEIWDIVSQMKGTDDWVLVAVREQIKLSLLNDTGEFLRGVLCLNEPECSQGGGGGGTAEGDCWHKMVLSEFLHQHTIAVETNGATIFDARKELGKFLIHYGYSRLQKELAKFYTDQHKGNKSWYGRSLMRTLRLTRPHLEERMQILWQYEKVLEKFDEKFFDETRVKIDQIGALTLYWYLYEALLAQHFVGWEEKAKRTVPISYKQFLGPKEYIGYWLEQMQEGVGEHLRKANKELKRLLELDRVKLRKIQMEEFVGKNERANAEKWAIVKYEKHSIRKKVGHYLMKVGKKFDDKPKQSVPSRGPIGRQKDVIGRECPGTSARPLSDKANEMPKGEDIERAIELNERMAKSIR
uniref:DUF2357 domain-containing protein n=1 Tax=Globodera pallida TaxID=36090 RepID=A0A183BIK9_GLOPA